MDVYRLSRVDSATHYGLSSVSSGTGGHTSGSFRDQLGGQMKEDHRSRVTMVLDELEALSIGLLERIDMRAFERYLGQLRALLSEIARTAYALSTEDVMDFRGRRRILSAVEVVDQKLSELAFSVLDENGDRLEYLSRVDEIRGLIMDILL